MDRRTLYWLHDQLPIWQDKGWISPEAGDEIRGFYGGEEQARRPSLARLLVIILGLVLIGLGIILLFAGYWYSFSPNGRFDWALALLALALLVVALALWKAPYGSTFAEGAAIFYMLALGASTALIGDTYYIGDGIGFYLLITLVLTLPIIYLLGTGIAMVLYLLGSLWWSFTANAVNFWGGPESVWALLLIGIPFYLKRLRTRSEHFYLAIWLSWAYVASIFGAFYFTIRSYQAVIAIFFIAALSAITHGVGILTRDKGVWTMPFRGIGSLGLFYVIIIGTFTETWSNLYNQPLSTTGLLIAALFLVVDLYIVKKLADVRRYMGSLIGLCPLVIAVCLLLAQLQINPLIISLVFDLYVGLVAILLLFRGTIEKNIGLVNGAIGTMFFLVVARFFDPGFSFIERGAAFITAGLAVIIANLFYMWRKSRRQSRLNASVEGSRRRTREAAAEQEALGAEREGLAAKPENELEAGAAAEEKDGDSRES